jgi:hypothetical protein
MLGGLRRQVTALERHLEFPKARLARGQIGGRGRRGEDKSERQGWQPSTHRNLLQRESDEFTGRFCSALWANQRRLLSDGWYDRVGVRVTGSCSDSEVRIIVGHTRLRTSESKDTSNSLI